MARIYGSTNTSNWGLFVDFYESSYSISDNTSYVIANVYLYRPSSSSYYGGTASVSVTVNGETKSSTFYPSYPTNIGTGEGNAHNFGSFGFTVGHNSDGSKSVSMSMSWSANFSPSSGSASGSITLTTIPRQANINSAPNFNDENNPTITYTNSAGNSVSSLDACISLTGSRDDVPYRSISKTGSSYTFNLTTAERNTLRNATLSGSNTRNVIFFVRTVIGGNTYYSTLTRTLTITNANPTLTASIKDVNQNIINITGDDSVIVKDKSTARITASATAKKGASITSITVNKKTLSGSYIDLTGTNKYEIIATDNRNLTNTKNLVGGTDYTFVNYIPLTVSGSVSRHTPTGSRLDISFSGNYFNGNIGQSTNNLTLRWQYKEKNASNWIDGGTFVKDVDFVINDNTFHSGTGNRESAISLGNIFSYQKSYEIKLLYNDLLENKEVILTGLKGIPVIDWGKDFFNVNGEIRINNVPISQTTVSNVRSDSTTGTYSCNYINSISGGSGTTNYNTLTNLPKINGITLTGNKTSSQLGINSPTKVSELENDLGFIDINYHDTTKQDKLVSGTNIKTINNQSILGSGNIEVGSSGTSDYSQLENKPQINGIELNGNKSLNDLGINNFSGNYNDLTNKPTIPTVPTTLSSFTDDLGSSPTHTHSQYLTSHQDISGKVDKVTGKGLSTNDFTNIYKDNVDSNTSARHTHSNKNVLDNIDSTDITNWNNKQAQLVSGTNIKTVNNQSLLGSGNVSIPTNSAIWGNITGTLSNQTDLQLVLDNLIDGIDNAVIKDVEANNCHSYIENGGQYITLSSENTSEGGLTTLGMSHDGLGITKYDENYAMTGSVSINSNGTSITGVVTPMNDNDAANKKYVDDIPSKKIVGTEENPIILNDLEKGFYIVDGYIKNSINEEYKTYFNSKTICVLEHIENYDQSHYTKLLLSQYNDDFPDRLLYVRTVYDYENEYGEYYEDNKILTESDLSHLPQQRRIIFNGDGETDEFSSVFSWETIACPPNITIWYSDGENEIEEILVETKMGVNQDGGSYIKIITDYPLPVGSTLYVSVIYR